MLWIERSVDISAEGHPVSERRSRVAFDANVRDAIAMAARNGGSVVVDDDRVEITMAYAHGDRSHRVEYSVTAEWPKCFICERSHDGLIELFTGVWACGVRNRWACVPEYQEARAC